MEKYVTSFMDELWGQWSCISRQLFIGPTFGDLSGSWSVGSIEIDLLDEFDVRQQWDEGHEVGVGDSLAATASLGCSYEIHFYL